MGFGEAIATCFQKYVVFAGRARRPEYWFWVLFQVLLMVGLTIVDAVLFRGAAILTGLAGLGLLLPGLAVLVRRLHDIDKSGWWVLIALIPLIGGVVLFVMVCLRGTEGPNRFGP
jgi:uncharacterized membrane protein YhaH (DUF805 family)